MNPADRFVIFILLSAARQMNRQTNPSYFVFVCRESINQADKSEISLLKLPAKKNEAVSQNSPYGKIYILMESRRKLRRSRAHGIYRVSERDKRIQDR